MHVDHSEVDRRTLLRAGLGAATVAVVGSELAFPTAAQAAAPGADLDWIISCDEWAARPPKDPLSVSAIATNKIIVHHMAFPNVTDYSREQAVKLAQDCQDLHMDGNGWSDTGQHFTVSRGGYVLEGRRGSLERLEAGDRQMISAHCPGENGRAIGIENEGTYVTETPPKALTDSLVKLCVAICRQYGLHAHDIFGHWDFRTTECPGAAFYRLFPECVGGCTPPSAPTWATCRPAAGRTCGASSTPPRSGWCSTCSPTGATGDRQRHVRRRDRRGGAGLAGPQRHPGGRGRHPHHADLGDPGPRAGPARHRRAGHGGAGNPRHQGVRRSPSPGATTTPPGARCRTSRRCTACPATASSARARGARSSADRSASRSGTAEPVAAVRARTRTAQRAIRSRPGPDQRIGSAGPVGQRCGRKECPA